MLGIPSGQVCDKDLPRSSVHRVIRSGAPVVRRPGGPPIKRGGEVEGAIGVGSAPTDEQDEERARCDLEALALSAVVRSVLPYLKSLLAETQHAGR